jgi:hypothetical protein
VIEVVERQMREVRDVDVMQLHSWIGFGALQIVEQRLPDEGVNRPHQDVQDPAHPRQ